MIRGRSAIWTNRDQAGARSQGWELFEFDFIDRRCVAIRCAQRPDGQGFTLEDGEYPGARFASHDAAAAYVAGRAEAGDPRAKRALRVITSTGTVLSTRDPNKLIA